MGLFGRKKTKAKIGDMLAKAGGPRSGSLPKGKKSRGKKPKGLAGALAQVNASRVRAPARPVAQSPPSHVGPKSQPKPPARPPTHAAKAQPAPKPAPPAQQPAQAQPKPAQKPAQPAQKPAQPTQAQPKPAPMQAQPAVSAQPKHQARPQAAAEAPAQVPEQAPEPAAPPAQLDPKLAERLEALEKGLSGLKNVQDLSELLSTKYNPFLDIEEDEVFEDKYSAKDLIDARRGKKPAWAQSSPGFTEVWPDLYPQQPVPAYQPPQPQAQQPPAQQPQPPAPPTQPGQSVEAAAKKRFEALSEAGDEKTMYAGKQHTANARESFLAMHWFTYLSEGTSPSIIFLYLDYYRYVGWIDEQAYDWLHKLAEGVATPKDGAAWEDFGMDVQRLSAQHLRNLRFIDKLLGTTLQHGEADYLRQTADMLLMED